MREDTFSSVEEPNGPKVEVSIHKTPEGTWLIQIYLNSMLSWSSEYAA